MKKIALLSDTHSCLDDFVLNHIKTVDEVWHAGDIGTIEVTDAIQELKPLRAVYGNIDNSIIRSEFPLDNKFTIENFSVWMTHIGGNPNNYYPRIKEGLKTETPNLFIAGHSHILKVAYDKKYDMLFMNPGAAGNYGIHKSKTFLKFEIDNGKIKNLVVVEKDKP